MVEKPEAENAANDQVEQEAIEPIFWQDMRMKEFSVKISWHQLFNLREYGLKKYPVDVDDNDISKAIQQAIQVLYYCIKVCGIPLESNTNCAFQETRCRGF